ncbi:RidA family protein [Devosia sp. XK-2]|uniref:RidA family protein n=1 Tax=Devosia sp. XK-2 TaxID=3126689 RepID=UPI0030CB5364
MKHLFTSGLIIMTMLSNAANSNELTIVNPADLFDPTGFGYSQAVVTPSGVRQVYVSGQGGADAAGVLPPDFAQQVDQAFANLNVVLEQSGARPDQVVKLTIYVVDHQPAKLGVVTNAVVSLFGASLPAQTLVPVDRLALPGMLFEVEAIAVVD